MSKWYDMKSMPIGDQRNIVVEVRGTPQPQALAYWTGRIWAFAPISDKPVDIGFQPVEFRFPIEHGATSGDDGSDPFTDVRNELEGRRWTFEEAATLIEMIRQGTAHLPTPADSNLRQGVGPATRDALDLLDAGRASHTFSLDIETALDDARSALRSIRPGSTFRHDRQACLRAVAVLLDRVDTIDAITNGAFVGDVFAMKTADLLDGLIAAAEPYRPAIGGLVGVGFAGGGGSSEGIKIAGLRVDFAMNHDEPAIEMHRANHPQALHLREDMWRIRPLTVLPGRPIRFMWFSPDCTHFSIAKGGVPVEKNIRALTWTIAYWAKERPADVYIMENVKEWLTWGPLDKDGYPDKERQGEYAQAFLREMRRYGFKYEIRILNCADYGDPTSRVRMFIQFRRDGHPLTWPEPTHGAPNDPDVIAGRKLPWRTAASDVIDFSQPCYSIFMTREEARAQRIRINRPLVDATFARITLGFVRYYLEAEDPFYVEYIAPITHGSAAPRARSVDRPTWSQTCSKGGDHALVAPALIPVTHQGAPRAHSTREPTRTITGANRGEIALAAAHLVKFRKNSAGAPVTDPAPTMSANSFIQRPGCAAPIGLSSTFVASVGGSEYAGRPRPANKPLNAMTTDNRQSVVAVHMIQNHGGKVGHSAGKPVSTICTTGSHQAVAVSHLAHFRGGGDRPGNDERAPIVTQTSGGTHIAEVRTFLVKYYSSAEHGQSTDEPVHSMTTKARFGLVEVRIADIPLTEEQRYTAYWVARLIDVYAHPNGKPKRRNRRKGWGTLHFRTLVDKIDDMHRPRPSAVGRDGMIAWDIGMRMFTVRERFRAQGVTDDYIIDVEVDGKPITATKQGEMCGNMVPPNTAAALVRAALPELWA